MEKSLYEKTVSETTKMLVSSVVMFILQFGSIVILARIYSPNEFGILSKITIITSFADVFCQLGLGQAVVQKKKASQQDYDTVSSSAMVLGIITSLVVFVLASPISNLVRINNSLYLRIISPAFFITSLSVLPLARAQREMRFGIIVRKDIVSYLLYLFVCVICGVFGFGIIGLVVGLLVKYVVATIIALLSVKKSFSFKFYKESFKGMLNFGVGFSLCKICSVATDQSDYYAIARKLNNNDLGFYNKAFQLISTPISLIGQGVDQVFFSSFSKIQDDEKRIGDLFVSISAIISVISMFASIFIFYFSGIITLVLFGNNWIDSAMPISLLSIAIFFRASIKITDPIMRAKGYVYKRALFHCINTIVTVIAAMVGSSWGLMGVSFGVVIAQIINYLMNVFYVSVKFRIDLKRYCVTSVPCVAFTIVVCAFGWFSSSLEKIWKGDYNSHIILISFSVLVLALVFGIINYRLIFDDEICNEIRRFTGVLKKMVKKRRGNQ